MGISRDSRHKRRATGGKRKPLKKGRKYELGRQPAMTKLGATKLVRPLRVRGGNHKFRALRLEAGNFSWGSESITRKTRVLDVVYNASNNELVRTKTLVKGAVVQIDATPFRAWYEQFYGIAIGKKKKVKEEATTTAGATTGTTPATGTPASTTTEAAPAAPKTEESKEPAKDGAAAATKSKEDKSVNRKASHHVQRKLLKRQKNRVLDSGLHDLFNTGRLLARLSSRPGQTGRADGYLLEGKELEFYQKKLQKKKSTA